MVNKERLIAVADYVEAMPHANVTYGDSSGDSTPNEITRFNMTACALEFPCGTAGCIAGVAVLLFGTDKQKATVDTSPSQSRGIMATAEELLGLSHREAANLFVPHGRLWGLTPQQAARAIRLFVDGMLPELAWVKAKNEEET